MPELPSWLPLFPLHAVLFPNGILPLTIFEARYTDMVSSCLKQDLPFGVALIREGQETGAAASPEPVGCLAHIRDWDTRADGLLTLRCEGGQRFRISRQRLSGQLLEARIELLPPEPALAVSPPHHACAAALGRLIDDIDRKGLASAATHTYCSPFARPLQLADAGWVANRWSEILPIPLKARQKLLELEDAASRLTIIDRYLRQHRIL